MNYDVNKATGDFFMIVTQLTRILRDAIVNKQVFTWEMKAGAREGAPVHPDWQNKLSDGSYEFQLRVEPLNADDGLNADKEQRDAAEESAAQPQLS